MKILAALLLVTAMAPADQEALYKQRFADLMRDGGVVTHYDPMEAVPGAKHWQPMRVTKSPSIAPAALQSAADYAAASKASAFMVWRGGALQAAQYASGDAATPLISKSLSKPLSAIAIGRAIALGKIKSLDQPVADFIPEWRGTPKEAILVRHLLDMRSGLLEQSFSADPDHPINRAYISPDHGRYLIDHYPLTDTPGSRYGYGNAVAEMVAIVIERATGQRYADFIGQQVLAPLGAPGGEIWVDRPGGLAHSGCCMRLPAESWLRLGILLADDGMVGSKHILPKGFVSEIAKGTPQNPHYGAGVWVAGPYVQRRGFGAPGRPGPAILHGAPYLDRDLFLFDGNGSQVVYISRALRMVAMRLGDAPPKTPEWDNSYLPNLLIANAKLRPGEKMPEPQPK